MEDLSKLGTGPRRKRASRGLHKTRAHLAKHRSRTSSVDSEENGGSGGGSMVKDYVTWLAFLFWLAYDVVFIVVNSVVWSIASVVLWIFSKVHDRILMQLVGTNYLYNVSWEDPRVDRESLNLTENDHVLTIASACTHALCDAPIYATRNTTPQPHPVTYNHTQ
jgi:hypothetical protein